MTISDGEDGSAAGLRPTLPFSVHVGVGVDDLASYYYDFQSATNPYAAFVTGPLVAAAVLAFLMHAWVIAVALVCVALTVASPPARRWRARERARRRLVDAAPYSIEFSSDGVRLDAEGVRSEVAWSKVIGIIDGDNTLILKFGRKAASFVPKAGLTSVQLDAVRAAAKR